MRLLRILVRLLPAEFRREYGSELLETAEARGCETGRSRGAYGRLRFWIRECLAVVRVGIALWWRRGLARRSDQPFGRTEERKATMDGLGKDLQHAARSLRARPGFAVVAVLTLGLGVGATTAMFSAVNSVLLRALPYPNADRVLVLKQTDARDGSSRDGVSASNMRDVARAARTLSDVSVAGTYGFTLLENGKAHSLRGWMVSEGFLEALGARARLGRTFVPEEFVRGGDKVVLLSHQTWVSRFGGDVGIVGRSLVMDGAAHVVVGVLPPDFKYPSASEVWAPRAPQPWDDDTRAGAQLQGVARLSPGSNATQAQAELDRIAADLAAVHPTSNANTGFRSIPLREHLLGDVQSPLMLLLGAVGLVLLIAAANVAGLLLARGAGRSREYALRGALGASARRLLRLVALESLLLAIGGSLLGIGLAYLGVELIHGLGPGHLPRIDELRIDGAVLSFALLVAVGSALLAGIVPALLASKTKLQAALTDGARGTTRGPARSGLRDRLVVAEIALALVLTIGAGLLIQSFDRLLDNELGFDPERRLAVQIFAYDEADQPDLDLVQRSLEQIGALPGVEAVGITTALPLANNQSVWAMAGTVPFAIDDRAEVVPGAEPVTRFSAIDGAYAGAMGIAVRAGRSFTTRDRPQSLPVAMVNEAFVRRHFPDGNAVGRRLTLRRKADPSREIVGVLADVRPRGFESEPGPEVYLPLFQTPITGGVTFVVKTQTDAAHLSQPVQEAIWAADPNQAIWATRPLTGLLQDWIRQRRFNTALLLAFAALALTLAAIGVYGLMSFSVEQRVNEFGIRRALGGRTRDILGMVLRRAFTLALAGAGLGLLGSTALTRLLRGMLFAIAPFDPLTFTALSVFVVGVAVLAAFVPALRATRVDPMVALRME